MKKVISMGLIIATSFLAGCGVSSNNVDATSTADFSKIGTDGYFDIFKDNKTGVHYIQYDSNYGAGLCPRYNADGSLYVD